MSGTSWTVIIGGEREDVYLRDGEIIVSGMCRLTPEEAHMLSVALHRAATALGAEGITR